MDELPVVTVVLLAFNRREELRATLAATRDLEYPPGRLDTIVVDNASTDGTAAMVGEEFPGVSLVARSTNVGIAGWNEGLERARGDFVLLLDDDCYLTGDSLRRAVTAARTHAADLVSFRIRSALDHDHVFQREYEAGLLSFWGCAVLLSRRAAVALGGFDPEIFVWAHEPEFTIRLLDSGLRHLHAPEIDAYHQVAPLRPRGAVFYRLNARNLAYTAAKLLQPADAVRVLANMTLVALFWAVVRPSRARAVPAIAAGAWHGARRRAPVRAAVSSLYRTRFTDFVNPLRYGARLAWRRRFWDEHASLYPDRTAWLEL